MFFEKLDIFNDNIAIHDVSSNISITYTQLETLVCKRISEYGVSRKLVFIEATNSLQTVVDYLACLRGKHVTYLLEDLNDERTKALIKHYKPNLLISKNGQLLQGSGSLLNLHVNLAILLSTSGSTGTPKFVKL